VAPASKKWDYLVYLNWHPFWKNAENGMKIDRQTATQNLLNLNEQRVDFGAWQNKLETNALPRRQASRLPEGYSHMNAHFASELITISIVTIRSIWHNSAADLFSVLVNFRRKFANLVAPTTDGSAKCLVRCKAHLVL